METEMDVVEEMEGVGEMEELLTPKQVAQILRVTQQRVYALVRAGLLPAIRVGRGLRFSRRGLAAWIRQGGAGLPGGWRWEAE
jgi:excisionase family DNA binding protein